MGVSKNKKKKGRDCQKSKNLQSKCEKVKKVNDKIPLNSENAFSCIFKSEDQHELKRILKTNTLTSMPLILGATILGKCDIVKKLIKNGNDINVTAYDKSTSLMWAVKTKNMEMIDLLVSRGADVTLVDDSGENVIFLALNSREWDENCFLDFWRSVKKNQINLEFSNKTGNRILHFAVKRQWASLVDSLIEDKVNINSCNNKGVSALTMAAAKNDLKIVNILLKDNANVFQEDFKGNTPICYTIANIVRKNLKPPYETFDSLTKRFSREHYEQYIERRLDLLISPPNNDLNSYYSNINKITTSVVNFVVHNIPQGVNMFMDLHVFEKIKAAIEMHFKHFDYFQSLLSILKFFILWCCTSPKKTVSQPDLSEKFIESSLGDILSYTLKYYSGSNSMNQLLPNIFLPLCLTCQCSIARKWLKDNIDDLEKYYQQILDISIDNFNIKDGQLVQFIEDNISSFKDTFEEIKTEISLDKKCSESITNISTSNPEIEKSEEIKVQPPVQHGKKYAKRMRRKAKALKAKIDKIRSADVVERIRNHVKNRSSLNNVNDGEKSLEVSEEKEIIEIKLNPTINSSSCESIEATPVVLNDWGMFDNNSNTSSNINAGITQDPEFESRKSELEAYLVELELMFSDIISKYRFLWALDDKMGHPLFKGGQGDDVHPLLEGTREEQLEKLAPLLPVIEEENISKIIENFNSTARNIQELFFDNNENYKIMAEQLKNCLLEHEIRGEKYLRNVFDKSVEQELASGKYGAIGDHLPENKLFKTEERNEESIFGNFGAVGDFKAKNIFIPSYMDLIENILPSKYAATVNELSPGDVTYINDLSRISYEKPKFENKGKIKKKIEKNSYHLVNSACNICDTGTPDGWDVELLSPYMKRMLEKSKVKNSRPFIIKKHCPVENYLESEDDPIIDQEMISCETKEGEAKKSRWDGKIQTLQSLIKKQLRQGSRIGSSKKNSNFKCDSESCTRKGHFGNRILGFDKKGNPVVFKKMLLTHQKIYKCIDNLMRVRHENILSYTTCSVNYTTRTLTLGTPLCEFNLGEYMLELKINPQESDFTTSIVLQLLLGLEYLHRSKPFPIVHGNLKPSNVMIDIRGVVRLAEFGLFQSLYVKERPPKSSQIWFARETHEAFILHRLMHCSVAADVQVAGMLVHFILTGGTHVFGGSAEEIMWNLAAGRPRIIIQDIEAQDVINWMVLHNPGSRPAVGEALNHVYFWPEKQKWLFILTCCGLSEFITPGTNLNLRQFYTFLDYLCKRTGIIGDWISHLINYFPHMERFLTKFELETKPPVTPVGLLRFSKRVILDGRELEMKIVIFQGFPALILALYRLIENTEWTKHPAFENFFRI